MKIKFLFLLFLASATLFSCTDKDPIVREWKFDHIDASELIAGFPKEFQDTVQEMMVLQSAPLVGKMTYDFKENGKVTIHSPDLQGNWNKISGQWILNKEEKLLTIKLEKKEDEYIVHALEEDQLIIELVDKRAESSLSGVVNGQKHGTKVKSVFK